MLKRFVITSHLLLCLLTGQSHAADYQDFSWNPSMSGMGWNISQQNNTVFMAWFNYAADGKASFLTFSGDLNAANKVQGNLNRTTGTPPQPNYNPASISTVPVGTASLEFTSNNSAVFTYNYDGRSGSIPLERFTFAPLDINGTWRGADVGVKASCPQAGKTWLDPMIVTITGTGASRKLEFIGVDGLTCNGSVTISQAGSVIAASGLVQCEGPGSTVTFSNMRQVGNFLNFEYQTTPNAVSPCEERGRFSGSR